MAMLTSKQIKNRLEWGSLFCHFDFGDHWRAAYIWHPGGALNGCHQPYTVVREIVDVDESAVRADVEREFPGIIYSQIPQYLRR